jgi:DNA repair exonuclease SbcCD ATPase subunit
MLAAPMKRLFSAALLLCCASLFGCGTKSQDCNKVIDGINAAVERIKTVDMKATELDQSVAQMKNFAQIVEQESGKLAALQIGTPELKTHVDAYLAMTTATVGSAQEIVAAMESVLDATAKAKALQSDLEKSMAALEAACSGSVCLAVMKRIAATNEPADEAALAKELNALAADLSALKSGNASVDEAVAAHAANTKKLAEALDQMRAAQAKGDAAQKTLNEVTDREDPLIAQINGFCGAK